MNIKCEAIKKVLWKSAFQLNEVQWFFSILFFYVLWENNKNRWLYHSGGVLRGLLQGIFHCT